MIKLFCLLRKETSSLVIGEKVNLLKCASVLQQMLQSAICFSTRAFSSANSWAAKYCRVNDSLVQNELSYNKRLPLIEDVGINWY